MGQQLKRYLSYFKSIQQKVGFVGAVKYACQRLIAKQGKPSSMMQLPDPIRFYDFVYVKPFGEEAHDKVGQVINWVIPDFGIGSGGHLNIFRVVKKLEEKGFVCRINIDGPSHFTDGNLAKKCIREHFFPVDAEVSIGRSELKPATATFATSWTTAYTVRDFRGAGKRYYFVQDFEPYFSALGSDYVFAEETYNFGFKGVTAGGWLADKLAKEYGMETVPFNFSYDRELYKPMPRKDTKTKKIFFYARPVTSRRAFELGLLTLAMVHAQKPDIEFVLAGWDLSGYQIPFPYVNEGVLSIQALPGVYSQCDVALVLSLTNLSLLPLETMACNCAVVSNKGANVEWLLDENNTKLSDSTPEALSDALISLLTNEKELEALKQNGMRFTQSTNWNTEVEKIAAIIDKDLAA